jgi:hypothetical protein
MAGSLMADTTRGVLTASWSDSGTVAGGSFWFVQDGDTLVGLVTTSLIAPCGSVAITDTLRLVRAAP